MCLCLNKICEKQNLLLNIKFTVFFIFHILLIIYYINNFVDIYVEVYTNKTSDITRMEDGKEGRRESHNGCWNKVNYQFGKE